MYEATRVRPLTEFLRNHRARIAELKESGAPEVLTVNGKAELVVQDAESYRAMVGRLQEMEAVAAIQEGIESSRRGELKPARQVLAEMKAKYGIPG
jgi:hypothetical protein